MTFKKQESKVITKFEEGSHTEKLTESLLEELNCDTAFTIPLFGGIKISESVAVTWIIMAVVVLLCVIFVRNLSVENPGKTQLLLESAIGKGVDFFEDVMGKENRRYIPYLISELPISLDCLGLNRRQRI